MIITPVVLPQYGLSLSDCETLLTYTRAVIRGLESVQNKLYEVSAASDEALVLICQEVEIMLSEAKTMQWNLNLIKAAESANKMNSKVE